MSDPKVVFVVWDDSNVQSAWVPWHDVECRIAAIISVGFIIKETATHLTITNSITSHNDVNDPLTIPKSAILKRQAVRFKLPDLKKYL